MTFVDGTSDGPKTGEETQQPPAAISSGDDRIANPSLQEPSSINTEVPIPEEPPVHPDQLSLADFPPYHTSSPVRPPPDEYPTLSLREASLMRRFIQNIAPWVSSSSYRLLVQERPRSYNTFRWTSAILGHTSPQSFRAGLCRSQWYSRQF